jgi:uridine kinase
VFCCVNICPAYPERNMQPQHVVDVGLFVAEWSKCLTFKYQRDQLYRMGKLDDCSRQWDDVNNVVYAKFVNDTAEATNIIQKTYNYQRSSVSPTIGVIWEEKSTPNWD